MGTTRIVIELGVYGPDRIVNQFFVGFDLYILVGDGHILVAVAVAVAVDIIIVIIIRG